MRARVIRHLVPGLFVAVALLVGACGDEPSDAVDDRSAATGRVQLDYQVITEADAGSVVKIAVFCHVIDLPDKKGTELHLTGDDASTLRWRFAQKPDPFNLEWFKVDGELAFETDGLIGDPTTAAKVLELRGLVFGETEFVLELVERDPAQRGGPPAKRLTFPIEVFLDQPGAAGGSAPCR